MRRRRCNSRMRQHLHLRLLCCLPPPESRARCPCGPSAATPLCSTRSPPTAAPQTCTRCTPRAPWSRASNTWVSRSGAGVYWQGAAARGGASCRGCVAHHRQTPAPAPPVRHTHTLHSSAPLCHAHAPPRPTTAPIPATALRIPLSQTPPAAIFWIHTKPFRAEDLGRQQPPEPPLHPEECEDMDASCPGTRCWKGDTRTGGCWKGGLQGELQECTPFVELSATIDSCLRPRPVLQNGRSRASAIGTPGWVA